RLYIKNKKISKNLVVEVEDISAGGKLKGKIVYKGLQIKERKPVKVHLILQKVYVISNREMELGEKALWSQTVESYPYTFQNYVEIPFKFDIKENFPENWEKGYELVLVVEGENIGVDTFVLKSEGKAVEDITLDEILQEPITKNAKSSMEIIAQNRGQNVLLNLLSILFVIAFPAFFWFLLRYRGQTIQELKIQIFYTLIYGAIFTLIFFVPLYLYEKSLIEAKAEEKKKKIIKFTNFLYGIVIASFLFTGFLIFEYLTGNTKIIEFIMSFAVNYFIDGLLGMFFILGVFSLISYIRTLITGDKNVY
ncbi:hypothetical protein, partial [Hydrogenivirga sp. 128-5-R1-1]|uniref:hypothetical protein n=1 Tax=Hydrogenivirga sp. 128-5-R1-1 TaxID=392423 RepID=UPI00015F3AB4